MKIKEVIEKTGLTDRAIRLYIDEGLAMPNIAESYSGRKRVEFSDSDVERLKNVAMLRKAGFSVADIKSMVDDNSTAKSIVKSFIEQTENNIAHETEIVEKLKGISFDEDVTLETICESLSATVEKKQVPKEDVKLTLKETALKIVIILFSLVLLVNAVYFFVLCCSAVFDVRYIKLYDHLGSIIGSLFYLGWAVIAVLMVTVILKNIGKGFKRKTKRSSFVLPVISAVSSIILLPITVVLIFCTITPFYSQTTDPDDYLMLDDSLVRSDETYNDFGNMYRIFPRKIPDSAKDTYPDSIKYFYEYQPCWDGAYGTYDICAEWVLSDVEYEIFKKDLEENFILENRLIEIGYMDKTKYRLDVLAEMATENSGYNVVKKGDWTLVYYEGYGKVEFDYMLGYGEEPEKRCEDELRYEESKNEFEIENWGFDDNDVRYRTQYDFLICAYNDKGQKVRYIASSCCGHANRKDGPYYISLDW